MLKILSIYLTLGLVSASTWTYPIHRRDDVTLRRPTSFATFGEQLTSVVNVYYTTLDVGTPPVEFLALLDTGSSDLVLESAVQADSCRNCTTTGPLYNAATSSSSNVSSTVVNLAYGIGTFEGVVAHDLVSFGSFNATQGFAATYLNANFSPVAAQTALLGLAWEPIARTNQTPYVENLWRSGGLDEPLFSLAFNQASDDRTAANVGFMTVGSTNSSQFTGSIQYFPLATGIVTGFWGFSISDVTLGGKSLNMSTDAAILDSGTNALVVPSDIAAAFYSEISGSFIDPDSGFYVYPCATKLDLAFSINGTSFSINESDFIFNGLNNGTLCAGGVLDGGTEDPRWIIGTTFMQNHYSVFRFDPPSIGLAPIVRAAATSKQTATSTATGAGSTQTDTSGSSRLEGRVLAVVAVLVGWALMCLV